MGKRNGLAIVLIFSLAFNVGFVGIWLYHVLYVQPLLAEKQRETVPGRGFVVGQAEEFGLAPQQRRRILAARGRLRERLEGPVQNARAAREEFLTLLQAPQSDPQELRAAERRMAEEQERIRGLVIAHLLELRQGLNAQQRRQLGRMLRERQRSPRPFMRRTQGLTQ